MKKNNANFKLGKSTNSLLLKLLQNDLRPRLSETICKLINDDYSSMPFAALIDITTKCNLMCSWCIDKFVLSNKDIPERTMNKLLFELKEKGILSIVYFGGGEPMMHNNINEILTITSNLGIDYALNTNGILLEKALTTIANTCAWVRVSLDAATEEKYLELHDGKDYFNKIIHNINALNKVKKGTVGLSFVIMERNIDEIYESAKLAKKLGCDFIQFKPQYFPNSENIRSLNNYEINLNKRIAVELEKTNELESTQFAVLITGSMNTLINNKPINQNKSYTYCAAQQFIPLITPNGVYVCPNMRGSNKGLIGDISVDSFESIWNSLQRKTIVNNINPAIDCDLACLRHQVNVVINSLIECKKMDVDLLNLIIKTEGQKISDRYFI